jgi:hypothetical protein
MNVEENEHIQKLLATDTSLAQQKQALGWLADYCEESYILNLPPSPPTLAALQRYSKQGTADAALKRRAAKLVKQYKLR